MIDTHAHILPGLDDGARDLDEAVEMCEIAGDDGVCEIIATPHTRDGMYENPRDSVLAAVMELNSVLESRGLNVRVRPGSEVRVHECLLGDIDFNEVTSLSDTGRYILVELPPQGVVDNFERVIFSLRMQGVVPVLAHIERNPDVQVDPTWVEKMAAGGAMMQITAASLHGRFGDEAQTVAEILLRHRLVHLVGSDCHDSEDRVPRLAEAFARVEEIAGEDWKELVCERFPRAIVSGDVFPIPDPIPLSSRHRSWWRRLAGRLVGEV